MRSNSKLFGAAMAVVALSGVSALAANPSFQGTYVTDPSQVASAPTIAGSTTGSTAADDADALQVANDGFNVYVLLTFNSSVDYYNTYLAIDSDNDSTTGYNIFGNTAIGSNFGLNQGTGFTEADGANFNTDDAYYGSGNGSTSPTTFTESTTASTIMFTIPLTTAQTDFGEPGAYSGAIFPTSTFTIEAYQTDDGNTLGPVEYTIAAAPEPASLSLLALGAIPMLRRRSKLA